MTSADRSPTARWDERAARVQSDAAKERERLIRNKAKAHKMADQGNTLRATHSVHAAALRDHARQASEAGTGLDAARLAEATRFRTRCDDWIEKRFRPAMNALRSGITSTDGARNTMEDTVAAVKSIDDTLSALDEALQAASRDKDRLNESVQKERTSAEDWVSTLDNLWDAFRVRAREAGLR